MKHTLLFLTFCLPVIARPKLGRQAYLPTKVLSQGRKVYFILCHDTKFLSLFPSAGKVTKRAAAAEKEAKNQFAVVFKEKNSPNKEFYEFQCLKFNRFYVGLKQLFFCNVCASW